jgi:hypothetical protein
VRHVEVEIPLKAILAYDTQGTEIVPKMLFAALRQHGALEAGNWHVTFADAALQQIWDTWAAQADLHLTVQPQLLGPAQAYAADSVLERRDDGVYCDTGRSGELVRALELAPPGLYTRVFRPLCRMERSWDFNQSWGDPMLNLSRVAAVADQEDFGVAYVSADGGGPGNLKHLRLLVEACRHNGLLD